MPPVVAAGAVVAVGVARAAGRLKPAMGGRSAGAQDTKHKLRESGEADWPTLLTECGAAS